MLKQAVQTLNTLTVTAIEAFLIKFMALNISNASREIPDHTVTKEDMGCATHYHIRLGGI